MTFKNSKVLITGGSIGIGKQFAVDLAARGARVMVCARSHESLDDLQAEHPNILTQVCDVTNYSDVCSLYIAVNQNLGHLDLLFNNAAIIQLMDLNIPDMDVETWLAEIDVNVKGTLRVTHKFLPMLKSSPSSTIINMTSGLAYVPIADAPIYSASKAAIVSWTKSLRHQLRNTNVSVVEVSPPVVDTRMNHDNPSSVGRKKWSTADFSKTVLNRLSSDRTSDILVGDGKLPKTMARILPGLVFRAMNPPNGRKSTMLK